MRWFGSALFPLKVNAFSPDEDGVSHVESPDEDLPPVGKRKYLLL